MKHFNYSFVVAVVVMLFSSFVYAKDYPLFWLEKALPTQEILEFSKLTENQMVETLRSKYKVHVIIVSDPNGVKNPNLTAQNLKEEKLLAVYADINISDGNHSGGYFQPHARRPTDAAPRPLGDEPAIAFLESAPKSIIVHEFVHFYLDQIAYPEAPIEIEGILYHPIIAKVLEYIKNIDRFWDIREGKTKEAFFLGLQCMSEKIDIFSAKFGEEMDVYRFMYEHRKELGLSDEEASEQLLLMGHEFDSLAKKLEINNDALWDPWLNEYAHDELKKKKEERDPMVMLKAQELSDQEEAILDKMCQTRDYINAELKTLGKPPFFREEPSQKPVQKESSSEH